MRSPRRLIAWRSPVGAMCSPALSSSRVTALEDRAEVGRRRGSGWTLSTQDRSSPKPSARYLSTLDPRSAGPSLAMPTNFGGAAASGVPRRAPSRRGARDASSPCTPRRAVGARGPDRRSRAETSGERRSRPQPRWRRHSGAEAALVMAAAISQDFVASAFSVVGASLQRCLLSVPRSVERGELVLARRTRR